MDIHHGETVINVPVTAKAVHKATLMKEDYIRLSFLSNVDYKLKAGDYVAVDGMNYYLLDDYFPTMQDEATFSYELQFNAPWYNLDIAMFLFDTYENGVVVRRESDWYITDTAVNILNLLARSTAHTICPISLVMCEPTVAKTFTFSSTSIIAALNMLAKEFELEWWFTYENGYFILHFGECDNSVYSVEGEVQFIGGARMKDPSKVTQLTVGGNVSKPSVSQKSVLRRYYYVFGSSRNIDQTVDVEQASNGFVTSIVTKRLALENNPQDKLEGSGEDVVIFDDIYPRSDYQVTGVTPMEIVTDEVIAYDSEGNPSEYKRYNVYNLRIKGFSDYVFGLIENDEHVQNIEDIVASGKPLSLKFITKDYEGETVTPKLAGFEFEVHATLVTNEETGESWYEFQIQHQDINGYIIPNNTLIPEVGDWVCIFNVKGQYIDGDSSVNAQAELQDAFNKWYANKKRDVSYTIKPFADSGLDLELGDAVELSYSDNTVLSRVYSYEKHLDYKIDASYTVSSYAKFGSINQLKDDVKILAASIANGTATGLDLNALNAYLRRVYLSKVNNDTASGFIQFMKGLSVGNYIQGFLGAGANIDQDGKAEFEQVNIRGAIRAAELIFNQIRAEGGEEIKSIGYGEILEVDEENRIATLKLEGDEWATIDEGDLCRGLYNTINKEYDNSSNEGEDDNGFRMKAGFFSSYFKIDEVLTNTKGECSFRYSLQPNTTEHPCPLMKFAAYGNDNPLKPERQSSIYITAVGIAPRMLFLAGVNDWRIKPWNIKIALGNINGLQVSELRNGELTSKMLSGDAGIFVEDNIYFGGILNQFTAADWETVQQHLGQGIHAQLLRGSDNITVDSLGNIVGGIYELFGDGTTVNKRYKLHTGVLVYDSGKQQYLRAKPTNEGTLAENEYFIYYTCDGCEVLRDGADFYITKINNTFNGFDGLALTDSQLELMRKTNSCRINFVIVTASGWKTQMSYEVKITHLETSYITFDLSNEMDSLTFSAQQRTYLGFPISTKLNAYINGEVLDDSHFVSTTVESNAFVPDTTQSKVTTVENNIYATEYLAGDSLSGIGFNIYKNGYMSVQKRGRFGKDYEDTKYWFDISCVVRYAGVDYISPTKRFILQETTNATIYKLLLSASAISKDEGGIFVPSRDDFSVSVKIIDSTSVVTKTAAEMDNTDVNVRYVDGIYDPATSLLLDTLPLFTMASTCITVLLVDYTDVNAPVILDIESVPFTAVGRNGAGQPWIKTNQEAFVVDCDSEGKVLADPATIVVTGQLYYGDNPCTLTNATIGLQDTVPDSVSGGVVVQKTFTFAKGTVFSSTAIEITITGNDGDGNPHTASKGIPLTANCKGQKGDEGKSGAFLRFRGEWYDDVECFWTDDFRDAFTHNGSFWLVNKRTDGTEYLGEPTAENTNWKEESFLEFIATRVLFAEESTIENLIATKLKTGIKGVPHVEMNEGVVEFYGKLSTPSIVLTTDEDDNGVLAFYDKNNKFMFDLGPKGIRYLDSVSSEFRPVLLKTLSEQLLNTYRVLPLINVSESSCATYYTFIEGYVSSNNTRVYKISGASEPSSYNNKVYTTNELSNEVPAGGVINGWFISPNNGAYGIAKIGQVTYNKVFVSHYLDGREDANIPILFTNEHDYWRDINGDIHRNVYLFDYLEEIYTGTPNPL